MGVRVSGSLFRVIIDHLIEEFRSKLTIFNVKVFLLKKYVDDVLIIVGNLPHGSRYNSSRDEIVRSKEDDT